MIAGMTAIFFITYFIVMKQTKIVGSDYYIHCSWAAMIQSAGLRGLLKIDLYPLWEICVTINSIVFKVDISTAAGITTALMNIITFLSTYFFLSFKYNGREEKIAAAAFLLMLIGPIYLPFFNTSIYLGQGTPNIWHSPTMIMIRAIAFPTYCLLTKIIKSNSEGETISHIEYILLGILLLFCNLAKPSFAQVIIPGISLYCLYLLVKSRGRELLFCIKLVVAFIPCVILTMFQYFSAFYNNNFSASQGTEIACFDVIGHYTPNIFISMILLYAFPIYVILLSIRKKMPEENKLMVYTWISSYIEAAILAEKGDRRYHANFLWGYLLMTYFVYVYCMKAFILEVKQSKQLWKSRKAVCGFVLLSAHLFAGVYYLYLLFTVPDMYF